MRLPLEGFRIIDVTSMISGPLATSVLGDQGADVIKVEPPSGDLTRKLGGRKRGMAPIFAVGNRNKRSVSVDIKHKDGLPLVHRLVETADVFVQNFRPGAAERIGLGEPALRAINPKLIYVSISGFGQKGPYAHKRVYDPVIQALSGLASIQGAGARPRMLRLIVPDKLTAITAAQAITAALLGRERDGQGCHVELSMLDTVVAFHWPEAMAQHTFVGADIGTTRPSDVRDMIFETTDGHITVGAVSDAEWKGLATTLGHPEWLGDERFKTPAGRVKHADERLTLTADVLKGNNCQHWLEALDRAEVPCAPVLRREELLEDAQLKANDLIFEDVHPSAGAMRQPRPAARFSREPWQLQRHAPTLGQHTREVLAQIGVDDAQLQALFDGKCVF